MRFSLILAASLMILLIQCEKGNCQEAGLEEPTTKKPGFFSRWFGKGGSSSTTTTTTTTPKTSTLGNIPAALPSPARQPPNRVQPSPYNPLVSPNLGPGTIPNYPKPHEQPSGLSLSYGPTPPPRGIHSSGSKTPLAPMATPTAASPTPAIPLAPIPTQVAGQSSITTTTTTTTTTAKPKAQLATPESFSDFEDPKKSITPKPVSPSSTTTRKPTTVKEEFPALPAPRRPSIKEDFPALPSRPSTPGSSNPTPTSPSVWGSGTPTNDNRVSFIPHIPASTTTVAPGSQTTEKSLATDDEIQQLTETLYNKETNSQLSHITVSIQGKTRSIDTTDEASQPLLQVDEKAFQPLTIAKMRDLFNNYELDSSINEYVTPMERKEENDFVDAIMATNVMRQAMIFLQNKGIVSPDPKTHRDLVKSLWFTLYSRGQGKIGSSGFEHVFANEVKNGTIIGLHNWVYFNEEEKAGRIDYKGHLKKLDLGNKGLIVKTRFTHNGLNKPVNTMFIGTSPELELALYTVCFELRTDKLCPVSLGGNKFNIQTYSWRYRGKNLIGSAYPEI